MSVYPSAWKQLGFHWINFPGMWGFFEKICLENLTFFLVWQENQIYYTKTYVHLWQYLTEVSLEREIFHKNILEKIKKIILNSYFPKIMPFVRLCEKIWYSQTGQMGK